MNNEKGIYFVDYVKHDGTISTEQLFANSQADAEYRARIKQYEFDDYVAIFNVYIYEHLKE